MLEKKLIKAQEDAVMRRNLGLPAKPGDQEILNAKAQGQKLQSHEIKELLRKGNREGEEETDDINEADKIAGLGFSKYDTRQYNGEVDRSLSKLEGVGLEEFKRMMKKRNKAESDSESSSGSGKKRKKAKHSSKKEKKDKKKKKHKKHKKKAKKSSSDSDSDSKERRERRKIRKNKGKREE
mmetsp:Transcript_24713/g.28405  ORF Transcript_24713/g.28405 Transcript_24713/m.28405 type:complete len:181 (+) Transcript_24713:238-780(+)